jgi:radical SAM superfamily enzyme YgiQ (UPF0313 family)
MGTPYRHILMIYPEFPKTYWGMQDILPVAGKRALMPPLGLLTIAALTPATYELRLVDLNCQPLRASDLEWADMVCFSAMLSQKTSLFETASRCRAAGKLVVFGGPFPTACPAQCRPYADVLVLNEGEVTWPAFLADLAHGTLQPLYATEEKPDVTQTPVPRFDLLDIHDYACIPLQFSRGCPFQCEFCDIIVMFGRRPRTKTPPQLLAELEAVYNTGYRGAIFIVDDNFIGNKREVKKLLLEMQAWNKAHGDPFLYYTEATINLADDEELLTLMVDCHFREVFVGLETPSRESLQETKKYQNTKRSLVDAVRTIQQAGLSVQGGFIVGFDSDGEDIFDRQIEFIRQAAIPYAMVGLLVALPGTPLYTRLEQAGRLLPLDYDRSLTQSGFTNVVTTLPQKRLLEGYRKILRTIYTPSEYFARVLEMLCRLPRPRSRRAWVRSACLAVWYVLSRGVTTKKQKHGGLLERLIFLYTAYRRMPAPYRRESVKCLWAVLTKRPDQLERAIGAIFIGTHFYIFTFEYVLPELERRLARLPSERVYEVGSWACGEEGTPSDVGVVVQEERAHKEFSA